MKRITFLAVSLLVSLGLVAQTLEEGKQLLRYGRFIKAEEYFTKLVEANPSDPEAIYWLGQLYLQNIPMKFAQAKELYNEGISKTNQHPLVLVGVGHVELLEHKDEQAKQRFEQAISATKNRKNKNFGDVAVLEAIGRANALGDSQTGDIDYGLEKLGQAAQLDPKNPYIHVNMGLIHLKRGGEFGGAAKRAFEEAIEKAPNYGMPYWRIGRIFESQRNTELFLQYYNKAVDADPKFAPAYLALYTYYQDKDVNKAKEYLDKFIANNDPDRETDFFYADYLFRSGKNLESIAKGKEIEAGLKEGEQYPKVYKLYALNYDRLGDSVKARDNMEIFMKQSDPSELKGDDYADMATYYLKFPGMEEKADAQVERAVKLDTSRENQIQYMQAIANAYASQNLASGQFKWLKRIYDITPTKSATQFYYLADAAYRAEQYEASEAVAASYIEAYPDQPQGYYLRRRAAVTFDSDTTTGTAIPAVDQYIGYLMSDVDANKNRILESLSYKFYFYLIKSREYDKAMEVAKEILKIDPENAYGKQALQEAERLWKAKQAGKISYHFLPTKGSSSIPDTVIFHS
jgi:tetratricopeptide (TPR) repeat protein